VDNPCTHIYSALSNSPLTLRDLDEIGLDRINEAKEKKKAALENFGIQSVLDLLETYPRRYIDRTNMITIADLEPGVPALVIVTVESSKLFTTRNGKPMVKVVVTDGHRKLSITFFNQKWREKELQPGMEVAVFGKPDLYNGALQMTNPVVDRVGDQTGRILPIYPQSEKSRITTKELGKWIVDALKKCGPRGIADPVPQSVIDAHEFVSRQVAFHDIHLPESNDHHIAARRRLAFDEVLRVQLMLVGRKAQWERESAGFAHDTKGHLIDGFMKALPFDGCTKENHYRDL
jgi:ATP-dependent DNA helicase RecG